MGWFSRRKNNNSQSVRIKQEKSVARTLGTSRSATFQKNDKRKPITYVEIDPKMKVKKTQKKLEKKLGKEKGDLKLYLMRYSFNEIVDGDLTVPSPNTLLFASEKEMANLSTYTMVYSLMNPDVKGFVPKEYLVETDSPQALQGYAAKSRNELGDLGDGVFVLRPCSDPSPDIVCAMTVNQNGTYHHFKIARQPTTGYFEMQGRGKFYENLTLLVESMIGVGLTPYTDPCPPVAPRVAISNIDASNVTKLKKLGSGNFGEVNKAKLKLPGDKSMIVALKQLNKKGDQPSNMTIQQQEEEFKDKCREFMCEVAAMQYVHKDDLPAKNKEEKIGRQYIVNLLGAVMDEVAGMSMIIEFCPGGSVEDIMSTMREVDIITMCIHTITAVAYLGKKGILHRDIASRNVLVSSSGKSSKIYKLSDFGMACLEPIKYQEAVQDKGKYAGLFMLNYQDSRKQKTPIRWTSPESIKLITATNESEFYKNMAKITTRDNVWSWAMTVLEVFSQKNPFPELRDLKQVRARVLMYLDDEQPAYTRPKYMPESLFSLINTQCMVQSGRRISESNMLQLMKSIKIGKDKKVEYTNIDEIPNIGV